jgi:hypothetical protein
MGIKTSAVAAIAAANGLPPPSATVITLDNSVLVPGFYNRVLHSATEYMPLLLPPAPTEGMVAGVVVVGFGGVQINFAFGGNGKSIACSNGLFTEVISLSAASPILFRFDADQDVWTVLVGSVGGGG